MKKGWKIFWIICAAVAGLGFLCCIAALILGVNKEMLENRFSRGTGWIVKSGSAEYEEDIREEFTGIQKIDAEIYAGDVKVKVADVEQVTVETQDIREDLKFRCYQEGEELKLETEDHLTNRNLRDDGTIIICLPADCFLKEVKMELGAGRLSLEDVFADQLNVDAGAGEAKVVNFRAKEAKISAGVGSVDANGQVTKTLDLEAGVGSIDVTTNGFEEDYNYEIQVGIGEVVCGESRYSGLGREKKIERGADKNISIDCGVGSVKVKFDGQDTAA